MTSPRIPAPAVASATAATPSNPLTNAQTNAPTDAHAKALAINLDPSIYGSFAEIGAGQEVARWFLRVGAAAGTVAQTISAYDKEFSDETYGAGTRYVSRERLLAMLDHEYDLLINRARPDPRRGSTRFFVFADTVAARNFKGDNEQHGWLGVRFQAEPGAAPSDVLVHVNLRDPTAQLQQEALGVLGVNLIYATFYQRDLGRAVPGRRVRRAVDRARRAGRDRALRPRFRARRPTAAVSGGAAKGDVSRDRLRPLRQDRRAVGRVAQASADHRARRFEPVQPLFGEMLRASAAAACRRRHRRSSREPAGIFETTIRPVRRRRAHRRRRTAAQSCSTASDAGAVIISDFPETYLLVEYLRRYTTEPIRLVAGRFRARAPDGRRVLRRAAGQPAGRARPAARVECEDLRAADAQGRAR